MLGTALRQGAGVGPTRLHLCSSGRFLAGARGTRMDSVATFCLNLPCRARDQIDQARVDCDSVRKSPQSHTGQTADQWSQRVSGRGEHAVILSSHRGALHALSSVSLGEPPGQRTRHLTTLAARINSWAKESAQLPGQSYGFSGIILVV